MWNFTNIENLKNRPLLAAFFDGENPKQLGHIIRWLHELNKKESIHIVPSHDPEVIRYLMDQNLFGKELKIND